MAVEAAEAGAAVEAAGAAERSAAIFDFLTFFLAMQHHKCKNQTAMQRSDRDRLHGQK